jgi:hypothetical protein
MCKFLPVLYKNRLQLDRSILANLCIELEGRRLMVDPNSQSLNRFTENASKVEALSNEILIDSLSNCAAATTASWADRLAPYFGFGDVPVRTPGIADLR